MKKLSFKEMAVMLCIVGAIILMALGKDGWGWLLFVAILL